MNLVTEWQARVRAREKVASLDEFASEVKRSMIAVELIPESAWIESASFDFQRRAEVILRWDTDNTIVLEDNYVPPSADRTPKAS